MTDPKTAEVKVVPVEPTEAMLRSGCAIPGVSLQTGRRMWSAMLAASPPAETGEGFQARVLPWLMECFGAEIAADRVERCDRFIEEALELVQSLDWPADRAHALVDYVFGRPVGEPHQEVGGVMVTLAALCQAAGLDMVRGGEDELARIMRPEIVQKIRAKQAAKPTGSALPVAIHPTPEGQTEGAVVSEAIKHLRAMSHVAPRSFEVNAALDFLARHDAAILRARLDDEGKGGEA